MQINLNFRKWALLFNFNHAYSFLFGMLGAMFIFFIANDMNGPPKSIATVNITKIINQFTKVEANKEISPDVIRNEVKIFSNKLEKTLRNFSRNHHLVLVPTEAVIAGCDDYTNVIMQEMMDK